MIGLLSVVTADGDPRQICEVEWAQSFVEAEKARDMFPATLLQAHMHIHNEKKLSDARAGRAVDRYVRCETSFSLSVSPGADAGDGG